MELTIRDRLYIPTLLPEGGNYRKYITKKEICRKVEISKEEFERVDLKENQETKKIGWDVTKDIPLHVEFTPEEKEMLKEGCEKISDKEFPDDSIWKTVELIYDEIQTAE